MATADTNPNTVSLEWIGAEIRKIQADQRTTRSDLSRIERRLETIQATMFSREDMHEFLRAVQDRISRFEVVVETRMDRLETMLSNREG